ncbi:hypothetical protein CBR_g34951 [Chara braunii]|uniref:Transcription factor CBF/NF-Y/archaeal histone domain-containing protein n=1 Tax=Chara braunii TaxID=69332 RepID=A0A388LK17_CHABU|nr:hypothetical protein CBR_g34951 [Chara braunii]|eukprot:GBG82575.1 hypothetical protein CBR_g34951 [Chara braunii]
MTMMGAQAQLQYPGMGQQPQLGPPMPTQYQQAPAGGQAAQTQLQGPAYPPAALQHYQHLQAQHRQQLQVFWNQQMAEIEQANDFKNHQLPLARIKKIMKSDEDVRMISAEAPVLFAKACEMFILELTLRSWIHTEENKRRTLQRNDIAHAITKTDIFDFLVDIVPRDDIKEEGLSVSRPPVPLPPAGDSLAYPGMYYMQPQPAAAPQQPQQMMQAPAMMVGRPAMPMDPSMMYQQAQVRGPVQYMQQQPQALQQMWHQQPQMPTGQDGSQTGMAPSG